MSALNATDGFIIHGWMVTELGLRGPELTTFAIVHQFSQSKAGVYKGGVPYIMAWLGCGRNSARTYLHALEEKGLIRGIDGDNNGVPFRHYEIVRGGIPQNLGYIPQKLEGGYSKNWRGIPQNLTQENNIDNNKDIFFRKEKILSGFFFQNWKQPGSEYHKLVAYNNGPAAKKKWDAMTDKEQEAVATLWRQEPQQAPRFDYTFLSCWRDVYQKLYGMDAPIGVRLSALDDKLRCDVRDGNFVLTLSSDLKDYLEQHAESFRPLFRRLLKEKQCKKLIYNLQLISPVKEGVR